MGTDIHYFAELRNNEGQWELIDVELIDDGEFYFGDNRNYELFDILAGVRSRGYEQIAPIRGLPDDLHDPFVQHPVLGQYGSLKTFREEYWCHSLSWLLLQELIDFPWTTKTRSVSGYIDAENYKKKSADCGFHYRPVSPPHPFNDEPLPQPDWNIVSESEMQSIIQDDRYHPNTYCFFEHEKPYSKAGAGILADTIPKLSKLGDPRDIRIVFWFDN